MKLQLLANEILKELPVTDIKQAAKDFGVSHYYFKQKVKSIETNRNELLNAVASMITIHKNRNERIDVLYKEFMEESKKIDTP